MKGSSPQRAGGWRMEMLRDSAHCPGVRWGLMPSNPQATCPAGTTLLGAASALLLLHTLSTGGTATWDPPLALPGPPH